MIKDFIKSDVHDYSELMKSKEIQSIINNIPSNLSKLETAYYVYLELGKLLSENNRYVLNSVSNKIHVYNEPIENNYFGICVTISELYSNILKDERIGIESDVIKRAPMKSISHYDNIIKIDGRNYMVALIRDLANIKTNMRTRWFAFNIKNMLDNRVTYLVDAAEKEGISRNVLKSIVSRSINENDSGIIENFINEQKEKSNHDLSDVHRHLLSTVYDYAYIGYIRDTYKSITYLQDSDLEKMDLKLGYSFGSVQSENGNHKRGIYTTDVLNRMIIEFSDNEIAKKYILNSEPTLKSKILENKLKYVIENMDKFIERNSNLNYMEQITSFMRFISHFISSDEQKRIDFYALKTGDKEEDYISLLKLKPYNEYGENIFYLYSKEKQRYEQKSKEELKMFYTSSPFQIVGKYRTYDEVLASLNSEDEIMDEILM